MLLDLCKRSLDKGIDAIWDKCYYSEKYKNRKIPPLYYRFLFGFVKEINTQNVLEIGTYQGGSSRAIRMGMGDKTDTHVVTIDIQDQIINKMDFVDYLIGDSLSENILKKVEYIFSPNKCIDLLYIDSIHNYSHVSNNLSIYGTAFCPKYIILDDISINQSMEDLWSMLSGKYSSVNLSAMLDRSCGFGIIKCR